METICRNTVIQIQIKDSINEHPNKSWALLETVKVYLHKLQKATYHYINVQAQWQCFNGGNWVYLENGLRDFVTEKAGATEQAA